MKNINGGGIMLPYSKQELSKEIFTYYLNNFLKILTLSYGRYGIVFVLYLPDDIDTTNEENFYKQMTPNENYGKIVKSLLIKIQFVNEGNYPVTLGNVEISGTSEKQIQDEINVQTDIFFKTFNYLQPLCPSIIYGDIIKEIIEKQNMLKLLSKAIHLPFPLPINIAFSNDIGIIVMEMINNSIPLYNYVYEKEESIKRFKKYIKDLNNSITDNVRQDSNFEKINQAMKNINQEKNKIELVKNISRYALLKLALETGYNHNDFHKGNILLQDDNNYFKDILKSPILIDFGRTTKLNLDILNSIKQKVEQKNYIGALADLCKPYDTSLAITKIEHASFFDWICGDYEGHEVPEGKKKSKSLDDSVNTKIGELFEKRDLALVEIIQKMTELHASEPNKYPLLPLSNSIKNNLYNGMIGGKVIIKRKTKKNKLYRRRKTNRKKYKNKKK